MIKKITNIGLTEELSPLRKLKTVTYNSIALSTLVITIVYSIADSMLADSTILILSHCLYMLTAILIIVLQYYKKYLSAEYAISILFPICFIGSSFCLGHGYGAEYYVFITGVGAVFIFDSNKRSILFIVYNMIVFLSLKLFFVFYPKGFFLIEKDFTYFFNVMNSAIIFIIVLWITYIITRKNRFLFSALEDIREKQEEIIQERTKSLKISNEELNRFTYISAHDLREPLRNILSFSQLLERNVLRGDDENNEIYLDFIKKNTNKIDTITKDIVYFTEIGERSKRTESVDTNKIIQDVFSYFNRKYENLSLSSNDLPNLEINKNLCYDLFSQLIENAIIHSDKKNKIITIDCKSNNEYYLFSIEDNANGISSELMDTIFVMFKKLQHDMDTSGSGIGLSVCKKIVSVYNGNIWAESRIGKGSTFYFTFPLQNEKKDDVSLSEEALSLN